MNDANWKAKVIMNAVQREAAKKAPPEPVSTSGGPYRELLKKDGPSAIPGKWPYPGNGKPVCRGCGSSNLDCDDDDIVIEGCCVGCEHHKDVAMHITCTHCNALSIYECFGDMTERVAAAQEAEPKSARAQEHTIALLALSCAIGAGLVWLVMALR